MELIYHNWTSKCLLSGSNFTYNLKKVFPISGNVLNISLIKKMKSEKNKIAWIQYENWIIQSIINFLHISLTISLAVFYFLLLRRK